MKIETSRVKTPVGTLKLAARDGALVALAFEDSWDESLAGLEKRFGELATKDVKDPAGAVKALAAWLDGDLRALDRIEVDPGGTEFQARVWKELRRIAPGEPITYADLARRIGEPKATRAVGAANGRNPIAIVIPCHRVIASGGALGGYAGGLSRKRWLLAHEAQRSEFRLRA